jgi:dolichol-phosphate mannosyltransferase
MKDEHPNFHLFAIAAVIPAYKVEGEIASVLASLPAFLKHIIVVDDCSPDNTSQVIEQIAKTDRRVILLRHSYNTGVGGAMVTGFRKALELGVQIVIKIDGDGQMDPANIPALLTPLVLGQADYTKGNRFRDFQALRQMPLIRRMGNMALSFLAKAATGYWNCFDPTNGFLAVRAEVLAQLPLKQIDHSYFFEISMLSYLYPLGAFVHDVPIPARYQGEGSNLLIHKILLEFPGKLIVTFFRRIFLKNFIYDFSMISFYLLVGLPLLFFGLIFGGYKWAYYASRGIPAPTGTVMLPTLSVIIAIQILLSAIAIDLQSVPQSPSCKPMTE